MISTEQIDLTLLGTKSDPELAKLWSCSVSWIRKLRSAKKIPCYKKYETTQEERIVEYIKNGNLTNIFQLKKDLGMYHFEKQLISKKLIEFIGSKHKLEIKFKRKPYKLKKPKKSTDRDLSVLGKHTDEYVSKLWGVSRQFVGKLRRKYNIKKYGAYHVDQQEIRMKQIENYLINYKESTITLKIFCTDLKFRFIKGEHITNKFIQSHINRLKLNIIVKSRNKPVNCQNNNKIDEILILANKKLAGIELQNKDLIIKDYVNNNLTLFDSDQKQFFYKLRQTVDALRQK